jgi:hypothetical protein
MTSFLPFRKRKDHIELVNTTGKWTQKTSILPKTKKKSSLSILNKMHGLPDEECFFKKKLLGK